VVIDVGKGELNHILEQNKCMIWWWCNKEVKLFKYITI
jgi:hypothetical protein